MHLRRIREHMGAHNWFAVCVDLFIVVLGVFLGMQVNNWNQDRLEHAQGSTYYQRISDDLDTDIGAWQASIAYYTQVQAHAKAALAALRRPHADLGEQFLVDAYQATQIAPRPMTRGSYDEAVSRGAFNSVGDAHLRDRIINYYVLGQGLSTVLGTMPPYRDALRRQMPYVAVSAILRQCADRFGRNARGFVMVTLPETCNPGLSQAQIAEAVAQLRAAPSLEVDLNGQINDLEQKMMSFQLMLTTAEEIRRDMAARH